ncbi:adenosylcobinamide kinase /adenosylcobinamide-phosphate guanylyltransferase [Breoghania corrubedonensis]|uniref:Bifunctional adenosylcobalamin biosynthesis protein n=1 Tax=Breoghania corrubedonensis TaxID=665038 RepID=A0A2T5V9F8_9HYPH|nr:adenosylcobinamide kinase /adenosylcobinamide-phosphate guanylyltransferase [Breoghania corrubedonensis]
MMIETTLILGGARSGKSRHAEALAEASGLEKVYVATGQGGDAEMAERIVRHQARRGSDWKTIEEPLDLTGILAGEGLSSRVLLIDCLTLWLSNVMLDGRDVEAETAALVAAIDARAGPVLFVSNEIGLGLVPETPLGREFRDCQGLLNQAVAAVVPHVIFVAAGLPLTLKDNQNTGGAE